MVYTSALVLGPGVSVGMEKENVGDFLRKFVLRYILDKDSQQTCGGLKKAMSSSSLGSECSLEEEREERSLQLDLVRRIERCLSDAKTSSLRCRELLLPRGMISYIARDILAASIDEPCGLRGALVHLFLEAKGALQKLGSVVPADNLTSTFELSVVLRPDQDGWPPLRNLFGTDNVLRLRPEYRPH
ncbi:DNA damage-inducible transcript 4-like protein-like [Clupea harengus]|uniref:DNA damage-inducible transcript 4-like protein-like n=1 Tax=Clupea harengus TaxID=7950 RepID=A0A6P3VS34_CLUHA|nr:DNA damage-inducible transcript 4-like protein-like [Clupea harengus]